MKRCQLCQSNMVEIMWQPFGPGEDALCFSFPGHHYRGFPSLGICMDCKEHLRDSSEDITFTYRKKAYVFNSFERNVADVAS